MNKASKASKASKVSRANKVSKAKGGGVTVLELRDICKSFTLGDETIDILSGFNLSIVEREVVSLRGASGSGKSTLLHIAGLLDSADSGEVFINGESTSGLSDRSRTRIRGNVIGFVFQLHHLWSEFTALENLVIVQRLNGVRREIAEERAFDLLSEVGLSERVHHLSGQLSGGERQRVAIARALANYPKLLLADEPTGNLDIENAERIFGLFQKLVDKYDLAVLMATHDGRIAQASDRVIELENC